MEKINYPNYNDIYRDLIKKKFPQRSEEFKPLLKNNLDILSVIKVNKMLFGEEDSSDTQNSQKYRSYDKEAILRILNYQKIYRLNNVQTAKVFNVSRNSLTKWRRLFLK